MTLAAWTDTELDRMLAEADRREAAHRAAEAKRRDAILRKYAPPISPHSVASGLTMLAGLLWMGAAMLAFAGLLAVL